MYGSKSGIRNGIFFENIIKVKSGRRTKMKRELWSQVFNAQIYAKTQNYFKLVKGSVLLRA